jgi:DNA-binding transcriptional regulator YiaG
MRKAKLKRLEQAGWRVGSATEFLDLAPEEVALIEMRLALSTSLKARRLKQGLSQQALASRLASSQSRVAKMEAGDPSVSLDLLIRALLATGAAPRDIARAIST